MNLLIAPSILSADFSKLEDEIKSVKTADILHIDVMDGHFVPNITIGPCVIKWIKSEMPLDVHLMIKNPQKFIEAFVKAGANSITVHAEECKNLKKTIGLIRLQGVKAGVSLNPNTPLSKIKHILDDVDIVLIMSVYPGFAGQKFIEDVLPKIKQLRELKPMLNIQVDGGITSETAPLAVAAGANILVAGSAIFKQKNRKKAIAELRESVEYSLPI